MLQLIDIKKDYIIGKENKKDYQKTQALKGVSIEFKKNEFVSILGQSGCGKTTLLNIIGGLDKYTSGDLIINGVSTKNYTDRDWDNYRNHSIGFIFQSYNLIPHQTILQNVELALTLSGIPKAERIARAKNVLNKVGLGDKLKSKPNQLSGGQMQRVAIARALINDPDIILADEPTGALDSQTSVQVMEILKEISKEKLIIMVTHNPDLATKYSTRIIKLLDGLVVDDTQIIENTNKVVNENIDISKDVDLENNETNTDKLDFNNKNDNKKIKKKRVKNMSLFTSFSLSLNNLLTKKARTFLISFAGSIGIIGIALILSISNGIQLYINKVQENTLSSYPITLETNTNDYSSLFDAMVDTSDNQHDITGSTIYVDDSMTKMLNSMQSSIKNNDLEKFNNYLKENYNQISDYISAISYTYNFDIQIYSDDAKTRINPTTIFENMGDFFGNMANSNNATSKSMLNYMKVFEEMIDNPDLLKSQYDVVAVSKGKNKSTLFENLNYNEIVLVLDKNNQISNMSLYMLGMKDQSEIEDILNDLKNGIPIETSNETYNFNDFLGKKFKILLNSDYYTKKSETYSDNGIDYNIWENKFSTLGENESQEFIKSNGFEVEIVGILRPNEEAVSSSINGVIGYNKRLTEHIISLNNNSEIVKQQKLTKDYDVLTGFPFIVIKTSDIDSWWASTEEIEKIFAEQFLNFEDFSQLTYSKKHKIFDKILTVKIENIDALYSQYQSLFDTLLNEYGLTYSSLSENMKKILFANQVPITESSYNDNMLLFGAVNPDIPYTINIYAKDFKSKDKISEFISLYNEKVDEESKITYTDYVALLMSSITTIVNAISYVLIAFVSVSLIVSSIMIGIITYISVLERTKEIGILRSIGASKKDIKRVFTSESVIIGATAGIFGIGISLLLTIPINIIIKHLANISGVANLPFVGAIILIIISMGLTFIAGLIPAKIASKKDPVIALRTE